MMRIQAFLLLVTAAAYFSNAQSPPLLDDQLPCTAEFIRTSDFTDDGYIGAVEFIHLLEDLAPPSCNVANLWQSDTILQASLQELSCECQHHQRTVKDNDKDERCCDGSMSSAVFAVPGSFYPADYDQAMSQQIDNVIQQACDPTTTVFGVSSEATAPEQEERLKKRQPPPSTASSLRTSATISNTPVQQASQEATTTNETVILPTSFDFQIMTALVVLAMVIFLALVLVLIFRLKSKNSSKSKNNINKTVMYDGREQPLLAGTDDNSNVDELLTV